MVTSMNNVKKFKSDPEPTTTEDQRTTVLRPIATCYMGILYNIWGNYFVER